jgi:hypothetical protein
MPYFRKNYQQRSGYVGRAAFSKSRSKLYSSSYNKPTRARRTNVKPVPSRSYSRYPQFRYRSKYSASSGNNRGGGGGRPPQSTLQKVIFESVSAVCIDICLKQFRCLTFTGYRRRSRNSRNPIRSSRHTMFPGIVGKHRHSPSRGRVRATRGADPEYERRLLEVLHREADDRDWCSQASVSSADNVFDSRRHSACPVLTGRPSDPAVNTAITGGTFLSNCARVFKQLFRPRGAFEQVVDGTVRDAGDEGHRGYTYVLQPEER